MYRAFCNGVTKYGNKFYESMSYPQPLEVAQAQALKLKKEAEKDGHEVLEFGWELVEDQKGDTYDFIQIDF